MSGGPQALTAREALTMATLGGARCLGREAELGSIEVGKLADLAVWRTGELAGAGIADPVCTLVFGAPEPGRALRGRPPGGRGRRPRHRAMPPPWPPPRPRPPRTIAEA